jgi:hypothetical protein
VNARIHRRPAASGGFAQIPNEALRDPRLSYRARGILAEILSRPDDWKTSAAAIAARARADRGSKGEGVWIVLDAFRELAACGYLDRPRVRGSRGRMATELHWYDVSAGRADCRSTDSRSTERPVTDASVTERSVDRGSSRTPSTNTKTKTDHERRSLRSLSPGELLQQLLPGEALADDERERFADWILKPNSGIGNWRGYLRRIPVDDLRGHLADFRSGSNGQAAAARPPWCGDQDCNEATRLREDGDGTPYRCPACHPRAAAD